MQYDLQNKNMRATQINFADSQNTTNGWANYNTKRRVTTAIDSSQNPEYMSGLVEHFP
jgi:hypothetical protein